MSDDIRRKRHETPSKKPQKLDAFRDTLKTDGKEEGLFSMWKEQEEQQAASKRIEAEYRQAKKQLRQTRKQIWSEYMDINRIEEKLKKYATVVLEKASDVLRWIKRQNRIAVLVAAVVVMGGLVITARGFGSQDVRKPGEQSVQGATTPAPEIITEISRDSLEFSLLYPSSTDPDSYSIAKVSPDGAAAAYTYLDQFTENGTIFRVTQQQVPGDFSLAQAAEDFQATSVIQIDDNKVYHGYSEKGRIQSLLFLKEDLLVLVRSSEKFPDDQWAAYYLSLTR